MDTEKAEYANKSLTHLYKTKVIDLANEIFLIHNKTYTIGDLISSKIKCNQFDDIEKYMTDIRNANFKNEISGTSQQWIGDDEFRPPILGNPEKTFVVLSEIFKLRHILVHESPLIVNLERENLDDMISHSVSFINAFHWLITNDLDGPRLRKQL